ncbi:MAG: type II secretion system protein [Clostridia bacterium]|nr:type II secretion system protein [Clostridia bacterium]MDD4386666.1 type II secretion system protein [Clostridia bacterium]
MKKGITLLALVATIVIMSILLTTVTISGIATVNNAKKMNFASEASLLQESVEAYSTKNNGEFPIGDSIQLNITGVTPDSLMQFDGEVIIDNKVVLYELDYELLGITSLKYGLGQNGPEDIYVVSKDTNRVYYAKGIPVGNVTYYTLTDELKSLINYSTSGSNPITKDGIVFIPSNIDWTKDDVTVQVKIPSNYLSKTVTVNSSNVSLTTTDDEYDIFDVTGVSGNYVVIANYAVDGSSPVTNSKFDVSNVDTVAPTITLDSENQQLLKSDVPEETYAYFKILSKSDSLSGIKAIKYENERIADDELESYFKSNGKSIYKDIITIDENVSTITVYIEDKAGNWTASFVTVASNVYTGLLE